jgi:hypothetical protein
MSNLRGKLCTSSKLILHGQRLPRQMISSWALKFWGTYLRNNYWAWVRKNLNKSSWNGLSSTKWLLGWSAIWWLEQPPNQCLSICLSVNGFIISTNLVNMSNGAAIAWDRDKKYKWIFLEILELFHQKLRRIPVDSERKQWKQKYCQCLKF